jgi:hypothetical protein
VDLSDDGMALVIGRDIRAPAVGEARHAAQNRVGWARRGTAPHTHPNGDGTLDRQRIQAGMGDVVPLAVEVDDLLGP